MATLSIVGIATGATTAQIGGTFDGGDSSYGYQRLIRVTVTGYGTFDVYSDQTSGGYNTFAQNITGLTPGTTYTWTAVLYARVSGGWSATTYTDSGSFTTESAASSSTFALRVYVPTDGVSSVLVVYYTSAGSVASESEVAPAGSGTPCYTDNAVPNDYIVLVLINFSSDTASVSQWVRNINGVVESFGPSTSLPNGLFISQISGGSVVSIRAELAGTYYVTLNFDPNGGTGGPDSAGPFTGATSTTVEVTIPETEPTRNGYTFAGWNTMADGSGKTYYPGITYGSWYGTTSESYSQTLYAVWTQELTGIVHIGNGFGFDEYVAYIWDNGWGEYEAYVWDNGWQKGI